MTNCRWCQCSAKAPRSGLLAPRGTTEAPRRLHEAAAKPSQPRRLHEGLVLHDAFVAHPFYGYSGATMVASRSLRGAFVEPSRSLRGAFAEPSPFNKPSVQPQLPKGRFHSESVISSPQPCVVSMFGFGLGLELGLCKKMATEPPRRHHGCFTEPSRSLHGAFAEPPEIRQIMTSPRNVSDERISCPRQLSIDFCPVAQWLSLPH